jgi:hypothetical protein
MDPYDIWAPFPIGSEAASITFTDLEEFAPGSYRATVKLQASGPLVFESLQAATVFDLEDWHGGYQRLSDYFASIADAAAGAVLECRCDSANMALSTHVNEGGQATLWATIAPNTPTAREWLAQVEIPLDRAAARTVSEGVRDWLQGRAHLTFRDAELTSTGE